MGRPPIPLPFGSSRRPRGRGRPRTRPGALWPSPDTSTSAVGLAGCRRVAELDRRAGEAFNRSLRRLCPRRGAQHPLRRREPVRAGEHRDRRDRAPTAHAPRHFDVGDRIPQCVGGLHDQRVRERGVHWPGLVIATHTRQHAPAAGQGRCSERDLERPTVAAFDRARLQLLGACGAAKGPGRAGETIRVGRHSLGLYRASATRNDEGDLMGRHRLIVAIEHTDDHRLAQRRPRGSDLLIPVHDPERGGLTRVGKIDVTAGRVERGEGDSHRQGEGAAIRLGHVCSGSVVDAGPARAGVGPGGRKQVTCRKASPPGGLNALSHCDFHHHRGGGVVAPQRPDDRTTRTAPGPGN